MYVLPLHTLKRSSPSSMINEHANAGHKLLTYVIFERGSMTCGGTVKKKCTSNPATQHVTNEIKGDSGRELDGNSLDCRALGQSI